MQLSKLIPSTLVFCIFLHITSQAQHPTLITTYSWDTSSDLWQPAKRDLHSSLTNNQERTISQTWDATTQSWVDWIRTTQRFDHNKQITYSLTEKKSDGEFVPVIEKYFEFDDTGNLLSQSDFLWRNDQWIKLYKEERVWEDQITRRLIYKGSDDNQSWKIDEIYEIGVDPQGREKISMRFRLDQGNLVPVDRLITYNSGIPQSVFSVYEQGKWNLVSKTIILESKEDVSFENYYVFDANSQSWQTNGFKNTYLDQYGRLRNIQEEEVHSSFAYDQQGRLQEVVRTKPVDEWYLRECNACGGNQALPQEVLDARLTREVYKYADDFSISHEEASFEASIYPNPTATTAHIQLSDWIAGEAIVQIHDLQGRLISTQRFDNSSQIEIERSNLVAGAYAVRLLTAKGSKQMRLVITD